MRHGIAMPVRSGQDLKCRAESLAQPTHLPAVADLVLSGMEPCKVCVHCGGGAEWPLQSGIIASSQAVEAETAYLAELMNVVLKRLASQETAALGAKCEGGLPRRLLLCRGASL